MMTVVMMMVITEAFVVFVVVVVMVVVVLLSLMTAVVSVRFCPMLDDVAIWPEKDWCLRPLHREVTSDPFPH